MLTPQQELNEIVTASAALLWQAAQALDAVTVRTPFADLPAPLQHVYRRAAVSGILAAVPFHRTEAEARVLDYVRIVLVLDDAPAPVQTLLEDITTTTLMEVDRKRAETWNRYYPEARV